jgi:hypothetical protein
MSREHTLMTYTKARSLLREIHQLFRDTEYWNTHTRQTDEPPIEVDPDGQLQQLTTSLENYLRTEPDKTTETASRDS